MCHIISLWLKGLSAAGGGVMFPEYSMGLLSEVMLCFAVDKLGLLVLSMCGTHTARDRYISLWPKEITF